MWQGKGKSLFSQVKIIIGLLYVIVVAVLSISVLRDQVTETHCVRAYRVYFQFSDL